MKRYFSILLITLACRGWAQVDVSIDIHAKADFEAPLAADGQWVVVGSYGRCWHPGHVEADWRPFCNGEWVWSDCGWYWQSDDPWAWACYHYGSWVDDPGIGWAWVPDVEWSPACVTWRTGGGYVGWAPCAPAGVVVAPGLFAFVEVGHFGDPIRRANLRVNDQALFRKTTEIRGVRNESHDIGSGHSQKITIHAGPNPADMAKATGKKFEAQPVKQVASRTPRPRAVTSANNVPHTERSPADAKRDLQQRPETPHPAEKPVIPEHPVTPVNPVRPENPGKPVTPTRPETPDHSTKPDHPETPRNAGGGGGEEKHQEPAEKDKKGGGNLSATSTQLLSANRI